MDQNSALEGRLIMLQSWWVASEVLRRHPDMGMIETHPGGGQYDCLTVFHWCANPTSLIDLNRNGSLHVHPDRTGLTTWEAERRNADGTAARIGDSG